MTMATTDEPTTVVVESSPDASPAAVPLEDDMAETKTFPATIGDDGADAGGASSSDPATDGIAIGPSPACVSEEESSSVGTTESTGLTQRGEDGEIEEYAMDRDDAVDDSEEEEAEDSESEGSDDDDDDATAEEEEVPDGDTNDDLHALLAFSKRRAVELEKAVAAAPPPPPAAEEEEDAEEGGAPLAPLDDDEEISLDDEEEEDDGDDLEEANVVKFDGGLSSSSVDSNNGGDLVAMEASGDPIDASSEADGEGERPPSSPSITEDMTEEELLELAKKKAKEAEEKSREDDRLLKIAEQKVREAEEKARRDAEDNDATAVERPPGPPKPRRDENAELWALLNYSKKRLEKGPTPTASAAASRQNSGTSSLASSNAATPRPASPVIVPLKDDEEIEFDDEEEEEDDEEEEGGSVDGGEDNVTDATFGEEEEKKDATEDRKSPKREDGDDDISEPDEIDEDAKFLDSFGLEDDDAAALSNAARSYGEAILNVADVKLNDVQMLQAMAVAEEAANTGEDRFTTRSSISRLHEAKLPKLPSFMGDSDESPPGSPKKKATGKGWFSASRSETRGEPELMDWSGHRMRIKDFKARMGGGNSRRRIPPDEGKRIGQGKILASVGASLNAAFQDFKETCSKVDQMHI